jgi:phenylacetate-CoA ligase
MKNLQVPPKYRNITKLLKDLRDVSEEKWIRAGERRVLKLFKEMAERVPAYRDFLRRHKINPASIKKFLDFREIPIIDKENYLRRYPLEKLCWDGKFKNKSWVISTTSGSTGEPFYFPREDLQDQQYAGTAELYLRTNFDIHKQSTLYIDAFPMGAWIGGLFTYEVIKTISERGNYALSIITPGIDKQEIINSVRKFGNKFDQIIIGCYGPFLKDAVDDGIEQGLDWKNYNVKFIFSAEGFTEEFRDYIIEKTSLNNPYKDTLNHYGTVDQGTLSYETPISILIRRLALENNSLYKKIFPVRHKLPTLTQYDPESFFFEEISGGLLCSSYSGLPLVRYDLKDHGGIVTFREMTNRVADISVDLGREARKAKIEDTIWQLPFVYVYERSDFSVSLYAFQVYPETIRKAIQQRKFHNEVTGKFSMTVKYNKQQNQYLEVNVELKGKKRGSKKLEMTLKEAIVKRLLSENSEYKKTYSEIPDRVQPRIVFWPYEHSDYFRPGGKQKWVIKEKNN